MKRRLLGVLMMLSLVFFLFACGSDTTTETNEGTGSASESENNDEQNNDAGEVLTLQLGHTLTASSERQISAEKFAELVDEKSNGQIKVEIFGQSQLGGEVKMVQALRTGSLALTITSQNTLENTVEEFAIFDLPYLFDSPQDAMKVFNSDVGQQFLDMLPEHDIIGLGWMTPTERNIFGNKPINTVKDLEALKVRVMEAPGYIQTYEHFKVQPTPMAYSEVYLGLEQGVVDAAVTSPDQFIMDKFVEVADYYNKTRIHQLPILLTMSKPIWDTLTEEQQEIIKESAKEMIDFNIEFNETYYDEYYDEMKELGVEIVEPDIESFKKEAEGLYDSLINNVPNGQELFDLIQNAK